MQPVVSISLNDHNVQRANEVPTSFVRATEEVHDLFCRLCLQKLGFGTGQRINSTRRPHRDLRMEFSANLICIHVAFRTWPGFACRQSQISKCAEGYQRELC
jgi:hypothetical protein